MPRRHHDDPPELQPWNVMSSTEAVVLAAAYLMPLGYLTWACFYGKRASANPWDAKRLFLALMSFLSFADLMTRLH